MRSRARKMNDGGAVCGTATYQPPAVGGVLPPTEQHAVLLVPMDLVRETTYGSGQYKTISAAPIFPADDGVGRGAPANASNPKGIFITLSSDLTTTAVDTMTASIGGPGGYFNGTLTETAANSGVFQDSANTVTVTLPVGTTTSSTAIDTLTATVTSTSLGLSSTALSLVESDVDSLYFYSPLASAEIIFSSAYNPSVVNTIQANLQLQYEDLGDAAPIAPISISMTETSAGSGTFVDSASGLTVALTNFTGTNSGSVDSMVAAFSGGVIGSTPLTTTLTETTAMSMDFTSYATTGDSASNSQGTDVTPDNPTTTGDGIFYIRIKGMSGPLSLTVQTDLSQSAGGQADVTFSASSTDPDTLISGKMLLVPQGTTTVYTGVSATLQTAVAGATTDTSSARLSVNWPAVNYPSGTPPALFKRYIDAGMFLGLGYFYEELRNDWTKNHPDELAALNAHLGNVQAQADPNLDMYGCDVLDQNLDVTKFEDALPKYGIMYVLCHGWTAFPYPDAKHPTSIPFNGVAFGKQEYAVTPDDVHDKVGSHKYRLVFLNCCQSADTAVTASSAPIPGHTFTNRVGDMANYFNCDAYVGWTDTVNVMKSTNSVVVFFQNLSGKTTVQTAVDAANNDDTTQAYNVQFPDDHAVLFPVRGFDKTANDLIVPSN